MASTLATVAVPASVNPVLGFAIFAAAAVIDSQLIYPALMGKGKSKARAPRLLGTPADSNEPGAPRVWAIGRRVRVPTHILWQDDKVRESTAGSNKAGTAVQQRKTFFDALIALNDRPTQSLVQMIGNGQLMLVRTRNLVEVETSAMVLSTASGHVFLTMGDTFDPDFTAKFQAGAVVQLSGWVSVSGTDPNIGFWKVVSVTGHTSAQPSTLELARYSGQNNVSSIVANAGTPFSPARVTRIDDRLFVESTFAFDSTPFPTTISLTTVGHLDPGDVFEIGDLVTLDGFLTSAVNGLNLRVFLIQGSLIILTSGVAGVLPDGVYPGGSSTDAARIVFQSQPRFTAGLFPPTFDPDLYFHNGAADQDADALLVSSKGADVPAYRGVACQGLDDFYATDFGDALPFSLEALIDPDAAMTWAQAVALILQRGGVPANAIDTSGVDPRPFLGFYMRGSVPTVTAMQPVLLAGSLVGQERDGTIAVFEIANADVAQIENDETLSEFGCQPFGQQRVDDKFQVEDAAEEDMPTSVGVRHQDPDNRYADGYQHFGLRNPSGVDYRNEVELDLSNLVLTRKEARNLAATHLRREHINRRRYRFVLGPNYIDLLENDILTFTDDDGNDVTVRIIQRDIDASFRVLCTGVVEDVDLEVSGSPVESGATSVPPLVTTPARLRTVFVDGPSQAGETVRTPFLRIACCAEPGSHWAGAQVWESIDSGAYVRVGDIGTQAGIGSLVDDFAAGTPAEEYGSTAVTIDAAANVDVEFVNEGPFGLEDATDEEAKAGKNWVALIDADGNTEIAAFCEVSFVSGRTWNLGRWLRGLRGTTPLDLAEGATLVMLFPGTGNGLFHRYFAMNQPTALSYKIVPAGASLEDVDAVEVEAHWRNALPLPVRSVTKTIGSSPFDARFTIDAHWCRQILDLGAQPPHPMDEPTEGYLFTIYDPTGANAVRTFQLTVQPTTGSPTLRDKWFDYTAAMQTADGYTPSGSETFWIDVQQIGEFGLSPSIKQEL